MRGKEIFGIPGSDSEGQPPSHHLEEQLSNNIILKAVNTVVPKTSRKLELPSVAMPEAHHGLDTAAETSSLTHGATMKILYNQPGLQ